VGEAFDYIVVGAGSAACIVAERLSSDPATSVLVLEAGPPPRSPWIAMPAALPRLLQGSYTWPDMTVPAVRLGGRRVWLGHGRSLGGSARSMAWSTPAATRKTMRHGAPMGPPAGAGRMSSPLRGS
jgi:choline dehydrogenase